MLQNMPLLIKLIDEQSKYLHLSQYLRLSNRYLGQ